METKTKHTPTPWGWDSDDLGTWINLDQQEIPLPVAKLCDKSKLVDARANAEFICRAVNNFDALLEAAKIGLSYMTPGDKTIYSTDKRTVEKAIQEAEA